MSLRSLLIAGVGFVVLMMVLSSASYLYANDVLETIGQVVVYLMVMSILCGLLLYIYVKITSRSIFDPLDISEEIPED